MDTEEMLRRLAGFGRRLASLADQVHETREQAQHALDRIYLLSDEVEQLRRELTAEVEGERYHAPQRRRKD